MVQRRDWIGWAINYSPYVINFAFRRGSNDSCLIGAGPFRLNVPGTDLIRMKFGCRKYYDMCISHKFQEDECV